MGGALMILGWHIETQQIFSSLGVHGLQFSGQSRALKAPDLQIIILANTDFFFFLFFFFTTDIVRCYKRP